MTNSSSAQEKSRGSLSLGLRCLLLLILILAVVVFASRMVTYHQLSQQKDQLLDQKEAYEEQIKRAEYDMNDTIDYDDIIRIAREKFNLAFPDDTVIYSGQGVQP